MFVGAEEFKLEELEEKVCVDMYIHLSNMITT